jgi:hypothetical protein
MMTTMLVGIVQSPQELRPLGLFPQFPERGNKGILTGFLEGQMILKPPGGVNSLVK